MWVRIASAAVGIPLAVLIVFGWDGKLFVPAIAVLSLIGLNEFYRGVRKLGAEPLDWIGGGVCLLFIMYAWMWPQSPHPEPSLMMRAFSLILLPIFLICMLIEVLRPTRAPIKNLGATALGAAYVGWLFSAIILLRFLFRGSPGLRPPTGQWYVDWLDLHSFGAWLVLFLLLVIWACDTGAYFTGRFLGKRKLAPSLSPGKTIEGLIGGLTLAAVVSVLIGGWVGFSMIERIAVGLILGLCSVIGDLFESAMKREIGVKDFGGIMPGHGGVLDRFDSLLFAGPVLFLFMVFRQ